MRGPRGEWGGAAAKTGVGAGSGARGGAEVEGGQEAGGSAADESQMPWWRRVVERLLLSL